MRPSRPRLGCTVNELLEKLLEEAHDGRIQVPEFQRELILTDEWMKSLLASASLGYPIGAVMLLEAGITEMRFEASPVADPPSPTREPERLLIDGRRRITGLYQALASGRRVQIRDGAGEIAERWYYIDIAAALDPAVDRDEAIISVPEPSDAESKQQQSLFPLRLVFGSAEERERWLKAHTSSSAGRSGRFQREILAAFDRYQVRPSSWASRRPDGR